MNANDARNWARRQKTPCPGCGGNYSINNRKRHASLCKGIRVLSTEERFWSKVEKSDSCWVWVGAHNQHGYGVFVMKSDGRGSPQRAHRIAYELEHGMEAAGVLDHLCHNRACVNIDHLRVVTAEENSRNQPIEINGEPAGAGVHEMDNGRFAAVVEIKGFPVTLGMFNSYERAKTEIEESERSDD